MSTTSEPAGAHPALDHVVLDAARTQSGDSLLKMSQKQPLLLVFLRHPG